MLLCILLTLPVDHVFVKSARTDAAMHVYNSSGSYILIGFLDEDGDFVTEKTITLKAKGRPPGQIEQTGGFEASQQFQKLTYINQPRVPGEDVYEYRTGKLVPGQLSRNFKFIPDLDGQIIEFGEYVYREKARRIYNLPGKFVTYEEYQKLKQEKK